MNLSWLLGGGQMALGTKEGARRGPDPTLVSSEGACGPLRLKPCATPCLANPWWLQQGLRCPFLLKARHIGTCLVRPRTMSERACWGSQRLSHCLNSRGAPPVPREQQVCLCTLLFQ